MSDQAAAPAPSKATDLVHDFLRTERHPLDAFFTPKNVAVIGATETPGSVGRTLLRNLVSTPFGGTVYPVNPKRASVLGIKAYPTIRDVPEKVDLAVVVIPAAAVPATVEQCGQAGVKAMVIISAGFKETGAAGVELERQVLASARKYQMRIVGPNCLGLMNPLTGLNASFAKGVARPGSVAFISQSGALLTAVLDWSFKEQVGFSAFVSTGSMLDVNWGDLIDYLGNDPRTKSILIYMESIGDARSFLSAAREVSLTKPIIVIKAGRTEAAAKAAASHTGSLTGSDEVLNAAFRRTGVLRVQNISDMFYMAEVLAKQPRPRGPKLTIITNAGGPGVLATDALIENGGELTPLSKETVDQLSSFLPGAWSHANPIDVLGDAPPDRYAKSLEMAARDPNSDGLLVVLTPQDMTDPTLTADALSKHANITGKPVIASWMGGPDIAAGEAILNKAGIPTFPYPDTAAKAFCYMAKYAYNLKGIYETPTMAPDDAAAASRAFEAAGRIVEAVRKDGRALLDEVESKHLLAAYGIPVTPTEVAADADAARALADKMGYPVVLKIYSRTITHKTDVGGVKLNLQTGPDVARAFAEIRASVAEKAGLEHFQGVTVQPMVRMKDGYELIIGASPDPQFGPVLLFGSGGQLVEVYKDSALALPPLNATLARRTMEQTKIYTALKGVRGRKPVDVAALEHLLVRFSRLVVEQRWIKEIDINPLVASPDGLIALDARVVVYPKDFPAEKIPVQAIRPYPLQYAAAVTTRDGKDVEVRPIRPEDEPAVVKFHQTLSERSVRFRYFAAMRLSQRVAHERLIRICCIDYDREMALVVVHRDPKGGGEEIVGVGRLSKLPGGREAEFALILSDEWQGRGLGTKLLSMLLQVARDERVKVVSADILPDNLEMQRVCERLGFKLEANKGEGTVKARIEL